jgi:hypothetical protein
MTGILTVISISPITRFFPNLTANGYILQLYPCKCKDVTFVAIMTDINVKPR